jgi:hypothetical protein
LHLRHRISSTREGQNLTLPQNSLFAKSDPRAPGLRHLSWHIFSNL